MRHGPQTPEALRTSYLTGFAFALVLTLIPFGAVAFGLYSGRGILGLIAVLAIVQILVHLRYFLHIHPATAPRENMVALGFAAVIMLLMVGGTLWIMFDLNHRMM